MPIKKIARRPGKWACRGFDDGSLETTGGTMSNLRNAPQKTITALRDLIFAYANQELSALKAKHAIEYAAEPDPDQKQKLLANFEEMTGFIEEQKSKDISFFNRDLANANAMDEEERIEALKNYFRNKRQFLEEADDHPYIESWHEIFMAFAVGYMLGAAMAIKNAEEDAVYELAEKADIEQEVQELQKMKQSRKNKITK